MYRLYYSPGACSLAAHIVLEESGLPFQLDLRSAIKGVGTQTPEYLAINPKGRVPALQLEGASIGATSAVLTELPAILFYLSSQAPHTHLLPRDAGEQARCLEWLNWLSGTVHAQAFGSVWRPQRFVDDTALFADVMRKGHQHVEACYACIEQQLADEQASHYNLVQPVLLVFWLWGQWIGLDMRARYPLWGQLVHTLIQRPAVVRALATEEIDLALF